MDTPTRFIEPLLFVNNPWCTLEYGNSSKQRESGLSSIANGCQSRQREYCQVNHLRIWLTGYQGYLGQLLAPLGGPWAILLVGVIDSAAFGLPLDPAVVFYVYHDPDRAFLYVLMVSIGSTFGATIFYLLGHTGGEQFVLKRVGEARFRRVHAFMTRFGVLALFIPAMLPPPTPFKLFEYSAGVAGLKYPRFLAAVFCGRMVRFSILAILTRRFGPTVFACVPTLVPSHGREMLIAGVGVLLVWVVIKYWTRWRRIAVTAWNNYLSVAKG